MRDFWLSGIDEVDCLDLNEMFNRVLDNYPDEFREYWGLDEHEPAEGVELETWERLVHLDRLAARVAQLGGALVRPPKLRESDLNEPIRLREAAAHAEETLRQLRLRAKEAYPDDRELEKALESLRSQEGFEEHFFLAALQLHMTEYLQWPDTLAQRVVNLTRYARRVRNPRAIQFLSCVSRCYLYGLRAETAIMARAALEAVLEEHIPAESARRALGRSSRERIALSHYINLADGTILNDAAVASARAVKTAGDDAVHFSAEAAPDADEVLTNLFVVLSCLEKGEGDSAGAN